MHIIGVIANKSTLQNIRRTFCDSFVHICTEAFAEVEKLIKNLLTISTSGAMPNEHSPERTLFEDVS